MRISANSQNLSPTEGSERFATFLFRKTMKRYNLYAKVSVTPPSYSPSRLSAASNVLESFCSSGALQKRLQDIRRQWKYDMRKTLDLVPRHFCGVRATIRYGEIGCRYFSGYKPCGRQTGACDRTACVSYSSVQERILLFTRSPRRRAALDLAVARNQRKYPRSHITWVTKPGRQAHFRVCRLFESSRPTFISSPL